MVNLVCTMPVYFRFGSACIFPRHLNFELKRIIMQVLAKTNKICIELLVY